MDFLTSADKYHKYLENKYQDEICKDDDEIEEKEPEFFADIPTKKLKDLGMIWCKDQETYQYHKSDNRLILNDNDGLATLLIAKGTANIVYQSVSLATIDGIIEAIDNESLL